MGHLAILAYVLIVPDEHEGFHLEQIGFFIVTLIGLIISTTVEEHFLDEHLWHHVLRKHILKIFLWTLSALAIIALLQAVVDLQEMASKKQWLLLVASAFVGIIPESGPHMLWVTLFSSGTIPLSVLITNSIVQDGHGSLPLLAHSRRDFARVKGLKFILGIVVGSTLMAFGL